MPSPLSTAVISSLLLGIGVSPPDQIR
jgi:hypothetical protein